MIVLLRVSSYITRFLVPPGLTLGYGIARSRIQVARIARILIDETLLKRPYVIPKSWDNDVLTYCCLTMEKIRVIAERSKILFP